MAELSKLVQQRLASCQAPDVHPEADLLTAFVEQRLSPAERQIMLAHLAECGPCRDVLALSQLEQTETATHPRRARLWPRLWLWAPVTAVVAVTAAVLLLTPKLGQRSELANAAPKAQVQTAPPLESSENRIGPKKAAAPRAAAESQGRIVAKLKDGPAEATARKRSAPTRATSEMFDTLASSKPTPVANAPVTAAAQQQRPIKGEPSPAADQPAAESVTVTAEAAPMQEQRSRDAAGADLNIAKVARSQKMTLTPGTSPWRVREGVLERRVQGDTWEKVTGPWSANKQALRALDIAATGRLTVTTEAGERWTSTDNGKTWSEVTPQ